MPLFRYFPPETGIRTLTACELMVIPPKYLNDPFECSPVIRCKDPKKFTRSKLEEITGSPKWFKENQAHFPNHTFEQFQAVMNAHASQLVKQLTTDVPGVDLDVQTGVPDKISEKFGIVCFASDGLHPTMWAHYGSSHAGLAIEFDEGHQMFSGRSFLKVEYSDAPFIFDASDQSNRDDVELFLKRKSPHWRYECESRLIMELSIIKRRDTSEGPRYFLPIDPRLITSVTLGLRADRAFQEKVIQALQESRFQHVNRFKVQKDIEAGVLQRLRL